MSNDKTRDAAVRGMDSFELMREFRLLAACAAENGEYRDAALEMAGELVRRGLTGVAVLGDLELVDYFLKADFENDWVQVSKEAWIRAERSAGFEPKYSSIDSRYMSTCATAGFRGRGVAGKIIERAHDEVTHQPFSTPR